jgi:hypothetical protein
MLSSMFRPSQSRTFHRGNGAAGIQSRDPLTIDQIASIAPSVMAEGKHDSRSARYTYVPTIQIVDHLLQNNYGVFAAMQSGSRALDKRTHTKHLIRFRPLNNEFGNDNVPEMVLVNSHDGTSAYRLMAGVFRLVCSNGLIVAASTIDEIKVRHSGNILGEISEAVDHMRAELPKIGSKIEQFQQLQLSAGEQEIFARAALTAKYGSYDDAPIPAKSILQARRTADESPTLYNTLNVVQESLIRGGNRYTLRTERTVQRRTTGAVNSVDGNTSINKAVWQLAEEMAKLKS